VETPSSSALGRAARRQTLHPPTRAGHRTSLSRSPDGDSFSGSEVARKHAIGTGLLYTWRQQILGGPTSPLGPPTPRFARVEMTPSDPAAPEAKPQQPMTPPEVEAPVRPAGLIEIVLSGGVTVRVDGGVNKQALRRVLDAMAGR
jgi:transposase